MAVVHDSTVMRRTGKLICGGVLSCVAIVCATLTGYWLSILWRVEWWYQELVGPICAGAAASVLIVATVAAMYNWQRGKWAVFRLAVILTAACGLAATGVFFAVLDNCRLSCGTKLNAEARNPTGKLRVIWYSEVCVSASRYCPVISHVSLISEHGSPMDVKRQNVFSMDTDAGVELRWKSDNKLLIRYWPLARVLLKKDRVGAVRIEYEQIPVIL